MARPLRLPVSASKSSAFRCVALSGLEFNRASYQTNTEGINYTKHEFTHYQDIATAGFNGVRLSFAWEPAQPNVGSALDETYMGYIDQNIAWAGSVGLKVILDMHNGGGRYIGTVEHKINNGTLTYADHGNVWNRIADRYKDNTTVWGYDTMNECHDMPVPTTTSNYNTTSTATNMYRTTLGSVRAVDTNHNYIVEADNYAGVQNFANHYGTSATPWVTDSANKLWYSWHYYFDIDHSGQYTGAQKEHQNSGFAIRDHGDLLATLGEWKNANGVNIFLGETGVPNPGKTYGDIFYPNGDQYLVAMNDWYNVADQYNMAVSAWAWSNGWYTSATTVYSTLGGQYNIITKHQGSPMN